MRLPTSALVAALCVQACADAGDSRGLIPLTVGYTKHLTMTPIFIAQAEGFFAAEGLDVELVAMESAATAIPALLRGRLDVLPGPMSPSLFNAILRGGRLRLVADKGSYSMDRCSHQALVVSKATLDRGEPVTIERVSTAREPFLQFFVERALEARGYDPEQIDIFHVPSASEYEAIVAGRLDAAMIGEPWLARVLEQGAEAWTYSNEFFDGHQFSVIAFGPSLLDRNPEAGRRFAVAALRAVRQYNEGKTERNIQILSEALGYDVETLSQSCWPPMRDDGLVNSESIVEFQRWALERGDLDGLVRPDEFWDPSFVEHARRVLEERAGVR